jgi:hypothetical protein
MHPSPLFQESDFIQDGERVSTPIHSIPSPTTASNTAFNANGSSGIAGTAKNSSTSPRDNISPRDNNGRPPTGTQSQHTSGKFANLTAQVMADNKSKKRHDSSASLSSVAPTIKGKERKFLFLIIFESILCCIITGSKLDEVLNPLQLDIRNVLNEDQKVKFQEFRQTFAEQSRVVAKEAVEQSRIAAG